MTRTDRASRVVAADAERTYAALVDADALTSLLPGGSQRGDLRGAGLSAP